jgi:hypothetical protein
MLREIHFNFQHFSLSELAVYLDGQQQPLSVDFTNRQYVTSFMSLFNGTGKENREKEITLIEPTLPADMHCTLSL